ncbi:MAG: histidine ammonia-lyase [Bacteroidetes bacterium GWF2_42_66]|nr:MAG: histidine ammonia-lyase [Bacteroidetes bacterium GWA2_42_15]OFX97473.1 MAG: histidine ammonia-lyase [Bacteroidetes bacterium GWE2_42_39]OFY43832.1 MAG: histidine ammonia-lyase [Bacteroidetes bacterium GWF2_42_66]HBL76181.1 histidine ammonia-lyase [Prolixibacteraceae bacterium]HCR91958.1 histidine ammonia-lyase [Prolixibacteraceae bacterium]
MKQNIFLISPENISFNDIELILENKIKLGLSDESKELILKSKAFLDRKIKETDGPIYGINTGFGALCDIEVSKDDLSKLQENLVVSHACNIGPEVPADVVRLMLLLKAHALAKGNSAVQLQTVQRIIDLFNDDILPVVCEQGSLGASGDLAPLAMLFLPLLGMGEVNYKGQRVEAAKVLEEKGWQPVRLEAKEGLALLNGTQFMSAHAVFTLLKAFKILTYSDIIGALSLDSFDGLLEPFSEQIQQIRPHPGQEETAKNFRMLLKGSELISRKKKHVQDPYSFRCIPQVHGAVKDAVKYVAGVVEIEINSVTDNPTVFPDDDLIISGGNFHGEPLAISLDFLAIALSELGSISERRTYRLIAGERGLPEFLVANPGLNSGFMIPQYAAASIVSQSKQLCTPASVDSIPSSNEQEDHVSMGGNAATKALKVADNSMKILAIELYNAAQAMDFRRPLKTSEFLEEFLGKYRKHVPFITEDTLMYVGINKTINFLETEKF